jgi:proteasome activator subunit 4
MIAHVEPLAACFALEDPEDPRYQYMARLRARYGELLGKASQSLRQQGDEIIVDAVHVLVRMLIRK